MLLRHNFESFGLDIGDHALKAALVKKIGSRPALLNFGKASVPAGALERGIIKDQGALAQAVKNLVAGANKKITTRYVHACLPEVQTFIKLINIESADENLLSAIKAELPNHIPLDPEESYLDWRVIGPDKTGPQKEILVGAVSKQIADSYARVLLEADLKPVSLQIEAEAILRSLLPLSSPLEEPLAVVDIGATRSSFIGWEKRTIRFSVSLPFSGNKITQQIKENLDLSWEEAEEAKQVCGLDPDRCKGIMLEVVRAALEELRQAIRQNIDFYSAHFPGSRAIDSVFLCGGGANLSGLCEFLASRLAGINFKLGDPLVNLASKNRKNMASQIRQSPDWLGYATAIGLALSNLDS